MEEVDKLKYEKAIKKDLQQELPFLIDTIIESAKIIKERDMSVNIFIHSSFCSRMLDEIALILSQKEFSPSKNYGYYS